MAIGSYLRHIARKHGGGRPLDRAQASDLMGQVLDGRCTDFEIGAFCLAMRMKGETPDEMAGFLEATYLRTRHVCAHDCAPVVVMPTYNGARKYPVLTPLLAFLVAREGWAVLLHGTSTEPGRIGSAEVLAHLGVRPWQELQTLVAGEVAFVPTELFCAGLKRLLDVRLAMSMRNSAHSLVKLFNPVADNALLVSSYTHAEYGVAMGETLQKMGESALLLHGTEGEVVADPRRDNAEMQVFVRGVLHPELVAGLGPLPSSEPVAVDLEAAATARYIRSVLDGDRPVPAAIARQVSVITNTINAAAFSHPPQ